MRQSKLKVRTANDYSLKRENEKVRGAKGKEAPLKTIKSARVAMGEEYALKTRKEARGGTGAASTH